MRMNDIFSPFHNFTQFSIVQTRTPLWPIDQHCQLIADRIFDVNVRINWIIVCSYWLGNSVWIRIADVKFSQESLTAISISIEHSIACNRSCHAADNFFSYAISKEFKFHLRSFKNSNKKVKITHSTGSGPTTQSSSTCSCPL